MMKRMHNRGLSALSYTLCDKIRHTEQSTAQHSFDQPSPSSPRSLPALCLAWVMNASSLPTHPDRDPDPAPRPSLLIDTSTKPESSPPSPSLSFTSHVSHASLPHNQLFLQTPTNPPEPQALTGTPLPHRVAFSPSSYFSTYNQDSEDVHDRSNEPHLRRRKNPLYSYDGHPSVLAPRSRSSVSASSTSSTRERPSVPETPISPSTVSRRSSTVQNRSSVGASPGAEHSGGWMSGLSEIMASVSSRVVNTRAQEQLVRSPVYTLAEVDEDDENENLRYGHGNSSHPDVSKAPEVPPWAATSANIAGSEHGSTSGLRRSGSKRSTGSHTNLGSRTSQSHRGQPQTTEHIRSGTGSHPGKSNLEAQEKVRQDDEESIVFAPGGFTHRGGDKIRLEGRSLKIFSPNNSLRLWLASVLMSK